ncbi:MAG: alpha/beta hydrolase [Bacteroidota bacterium]|jgi:pimeloyl-ACP methyl ester carboxylesterase|nr:alpha/beta hydrolase [Bacteroidota bacterium]
MVKNIFRSFIVLLLATIAMVIITPVLSFNELLYPVRIDSAYLSQQQILHEKQMREKGKDSLGIFIYSPKQLNIHYMNISYTLSDSVKLRGWMAIDTLRMQAPLLLIIPDINEGAINYIPAMKQFCDRGFNVCVVNMRGQGDSEGIFYHPGNVSANDVKQLLLDLQKMPFIQHVALMGSGTGAGIAMKLVSDTAIAKVVILQNPPSSLSHYFKDKAIERWGTYIIPILPALIRSYEDQTGLLVKDYNYKEMITEINIPQMMVAANFMHKKVMDETLEVYHASTWYKKRLYIDAKSYQQRTGTENSKIYYDKLAAFISSSLPPKSKKTRFRRLAVN